MRQCRLLRRCLSYAFLFTLVWFLRPRDAFGQTPSGELTPGVRVRVTVEDATRPTGIRWREQRIHGTLVTTSEDSLSLRPNPAASTFALPWSAVRDVEVSRGISYARSIAEQAGVSALTGAVLCMYGVADCDERFDSQTEQIAAGAAVGALLGGILGIFTPEEQWKRVPLPEGVSLLPQAHRVGIFAALTF